ncbi:Wzz/FepE/Etk N-terminal domain-containing protein [Vibrio sp. PP-XX7]
MSKIENNPPGSESAPFYNPMHQVTDDEIDLRVLFSVLWNGKWWVALFSLLSGLAGGYYALISPNIYESQVLVAPVSTESMSASSMLANQFGGLSSLVGINLGGGLRQNNGCPSGTAVA